MKIVINFLMKIFSQPLKPLGRWNIDYCNIKINKKIDWSNHDHCGPCGKLLIKPEKQVIKK
jgi:hypothetical protein